MAPPEVPVDFSSTFYANAVKSKIRELLINQKANSCPMAVRLAWHASGTYSAKDRTGGSNGATMRFAPESEDGANAGLNIERDILLPVKRAFPELSIADIWTLAGSVAIEFSGGPIIEHHFGRTDAKNGAACPAIGRLPDASQGAQHLRDVFYRMGFNDRDIVALSGAHTLGRCHKSRSGFDGPWTNDPLTFDNSYFRILMENDWKLRKWNGNEQYEDASGKLMMLPTDLAIKTDKDFAKHTKEFAKDQDAFFVAFKSAYERLLSLGCPASAQPGTAASKEKVTKKEAASRELREHCMHGSLEHAQAQKAAGGDPKSVEANSGRTALHKAAFWGHDHIVPWLLGPCGVDPNVCDYAGDTALHDAARFGHSKVIELLVQGGASTSVLNHAGQTAGDVAKENEKDVGLPTSRKGLSLTDVAFAIVPLVAIAAYYSLSTQ
jgi:catalase (peroxidase I)